MLGLQIVLTAFLVNLVSISSDQYESRSASASSKIRHDFQNFLHSVANKEPSDSLRDILQEEVADGEHDFDAVKSEMKAMQSQHADRKRSPAYRTGKISPVKREINESGKYVIPDSYKEHREYEEKFVELYGVDNKTAGEWEGVRITWPNRPPLYHYMHECHEAAKLEPVGRMRMVLLQKRLLMFKFTEASNITTDLLIYGIEDHFKYASVPYWYFVTKGLRKDCVFYLQEEDEFQEVFTLYNHVCGIPEFVPVPSNWSMTTKRSYIWPWQTSPKPARGPNEYY